MGLAPAAVRPLTEKWCRQRMNFFFQFRKLAMKGKSWCVRCKETDVCSVSGVTRTDNAVWQKQPNHYLNETNGNSTLKGKKKTCKCSCTVQIYTWVWEQENIRCNTDNCSDFCSKFNGMCNQLHLQLYLHSIICTRNIYPHSTPRTDVPLWFCPSLSGIYIYTHTRDARAVVNCSSKQVHK